MMDKLSELADRELFTLAAVYETQLHSVNERCRRAGMTDTVAHLMASQPALSGLFAVRTEAKNRGIIDGEVR